MIFQNSADIAATAVDGQRAIEELQSIFESVYRDSGATGGTHVDSIETIVSPIPIGPIGRFCF